MKTILLTLCVIYEVQCANILGLYHVPSVSHVTLGEVLMKGLAARGHNITFLSPYPMKQPIPNIKHLLIDNMTEPFEKLAFHLREAKKKSVVEQFLEFSQVAKILTEQLLRSECIKSIRESKPKYDVIVADYFFNIAHLGLADEFGSQFIPISSSHSGIVDYLTGNPTPLSYVSNFALPFSDRMNFLERVANTIVGNLGIAYLYGIINPEQRRIFNEHFKDGPSLDELIRKIPLVMANTHFSLETPRPYVPNIIHIGGFHVQEPKELPTHLKRFLDEAENGVVYCSLGSNVKSSELPEEKIEALVAAFAGLPQRILWKWEDDNAPRATKNVRFEKWLPQRDVLAHPNVKVFITQGGLLSMMEAITSGVPMIGIPFFGDQHGNVHSIHQGGYGIKLSFDTFTRDTLSHSVKEILENPKYRKEIDFRKSIFLNRQSKPLDTAIYWVEYVIAYRGAKHLHCEGADLNLFQYWLIDVLAFIILVPSVVFISLIITCKVCCRIINKKQVKNKRE